MQKLERFPMSSQNVSRQDWRNLAQSNQPFNPQATWDTSGNEIQLTMQLSGFSRDHLRINLNTSTNTLIVAGQKSDGFNVTRLNERIPINEDCSLDGVRAKFLNNTLTVIFKKKKN